MFIFPWDVKRVPVLAILVGATQSNISTPLATASEDFKVFEVRKRLVGNDLNDVSIEEEMAKLSQNRIAYEVYMRFATNSLGELKNVIREGRQ